MDLEGIALNEINQRKTIIIWTLLYMESLKKTNNKLIDTENKLVVARGGFGGGRNGWMGN